MNLKDAFRSAIESIRALRAPSSRARVVLDMTGDQIALILADGKARAVLLGASMEEAARKAAERLSRGTVVHCILPARIVTVRRWPVPGASRGALHKIVAARVAAEMPLVAGDLVWSWELANGPEGRVAVVHLVKRRTVEDAAGALEKAGLIPGIFENEASLLAGLTASSGETGEALILRRSADVGYLVETDGAGPKGTLAVGAFGKSTAWVGELARRWREKGAGTKSVRLYVAPGIEPDVLGIAQDAFAQEPRALPAAGPAEIRNSFPAAGAALATARAARRLNLNPFSERLSFAGQVKEFLGVHFGLVAAVCAFVLIVCGIFDFV